jgi:hypothetical protein
MYPLLPRKITDAGFPAGVQAAHLEHDLGVAVVESRNLGVRRLLVVLVDVLASGRNGARWQAAAEAPARHIHLVDTLIADVAVARVPEPVPVVFEA